MTDDERDEQFYRDTQNAAFPKLTDAQLALLSPLGKRRVVRAGETLFSVGQRNLDLVVVLTGEIEVYDQLDDRELVLATPGPRDFIGDVSLLNGTSAIASARGKAEESEVLEVPASELRRALAELPGVGEPVTQAFILRRQRLQRDRNFAGLRIVAERECREGQRMNDFLDKNHIPHRFIEDDSEEGRGVCARFRLTPSHLPALIASDGTIFHRPALREIAQVAGLLRPLAHEGDRDIFCDLAVVGAGPAGLSAAVNAASEGLRTVVLEAYAPGGQAASSSLIENFFGFPTGISGGDLTSRAQLQAFRFGAQFTTPTQVLSLSLSESEYRAALRMEGCHATLHAKCVIIATGAEYRRIEAEGRERFDGLGIYYAATAMEAKVCHGATVVVVGAGNSAGQAAMFLSEVAEKVLLIVRGDNLAKSMSSYLSVRVEAKANIEILRTTEIRRMTGTDWLEEIELENVSTGEKRIVRTTAVFSMIGAKPCTDWVPPEIQRDEREFIKTGPSGAKAASWTDATREPGPLETSFPGVFAAGDVRSGSVKRCSAAVGEGGMAVEEVHRFLRTYT